VEFQEIDGKSGMLRKNFAKKNCLLLTQLNSAWLTFAGLVLPALKILFLFLVITLSILLLNKSSSTSQ